MSSTGTSEVAALIGLMETHGNLPGVQAHGCGMLAALANDASRDSKYTIARVGGIRAVIQAMKNYPKDAAVQAHGCNALARLAFRHQDNQMAIAQEDGIGQILTAMHWHGRDAAVQMNGCGALLNLASMEENKRVITTADSIGVIREAMRHHPTRDEVQELGHAAVTFLSK